VCSDCVKIIGSRASVVCLCSMTIAVEMPAAAAVEVMATRTGLTRDTSRCQVLLGFLHINWLLLLCWNTDHRHDVATRMDLAMQLWFLA